MSVGRASRVHRRIETAAIVAVVVLSLGLLARLWQAAHANDWWLIVLAAVLGYAAADLLSGLVHWLFDRWGSDATPIVGRSFIAPFREHHRDPDSITRHDFIETNGNNCLAVLPVLAGAWLMPATTSASLFGLVLLFTASLGLVATNQIHKWAHQQVAPGVIRWLQRRWLILPVDHHGRHHAPPHQTHYCITTGWMNPLLSGLNVHRRVERVFGAVGRRWKAEGRRPRLSGREPADRSFSSRR